MGKTITRSLHLSIEAQRVGQEGALAVGPVGMQGEHREEEMHGQRPRPGIAGAPAEELHLRRDVGQEARRAFARQVQGQVIGLRLLHLVAAGEDQVIALDRMVQLGEVVAQVAEDRVFPIADGAARVDHLDLLLPEIEEGVGEAQVPVHDAGQGIGGRGDGGGLVRDAAERGEAAPARAPFGVEVDAGGTGPLLQPRGGLVEGQDAQRVGRQMRGGGLGAELPRGAEEVEAAFQDARPARLFQPPEDEELVQGRAELIADAVAIALPPQEGRGVEAQRRGDVLEPVGLGGKLVAFLARLEHGAPGDRDGVEGAGRADLGAGPVEGLQVAEVQPTVQQAEGQRVAGVVEGQGAQEVAPRLRQGTAQGRGGGEGEPAAEDLVLPRGGAGAAVDEAALQPAAEDAPAIGIRAGGDADLVQRFRQGFEEERVAVQDADRAAGVREGQGIGDALAEAEPVRDEEEFHAGGQELGLVPVLRLEALRQGQHHALAEAAQAGDLRGEEPVVPEGQEAGRQLAEFGADLGVHIGGRGDQRERGVRAHAAFRPRLSRVVISSWLMRTNSSGRRALSSTWKPSCPHHGLPTWISS